MNDTTWDAHSLNYWIFKRTYRVCLRSEFPDYSSTLSICSRTSCSGYTSHGVSTFGSDIYQDGDDGNKFINIFALEKNI